MHNSLELRDDQRAFSPSTSSIQLALIDVNDFNEVKPTDGSITAFRGGREEVKEEIVKSVSKGRHESDVLEGLEKDFKSKVKVKYDSELSDNIDGKWISRNRVDKERVEANYISSAKSDSSLSKHIRPISAVNNNEPTDILGKKQHHLISRMGFTLNDASASTYAIESSVDRIIRAEPSNIMASCIYPSREEVDCVGNAERKEGDNSEQHDKHSLSKDNKNKRSNSTCIIA